VILSSNKITTAQPRINFFSQRRNKCLIKIDEDIQVTNEDIDKDKLENKIEQEESVTNTVSQSTRINPNEISIKNTKLSSKSDNKSTII
jgi:hypothetical protein